MFRLRNLKPISGRRNILIPYPALKLLWANGVKYSTIDMPLWTVKAKRFGTSTVKILTRPGLYFILVFFHPVSIWLLHLRSKQGY